MSRRTGRVFLDTNIIILAFAYRNCDVLSLLEQIHEEIWIHQKVLEEMHSGPLRARTQKFINEGIPSRIIQDTFEDLCIMFFKEELLSRKDCLILNTPKREEAIQASSPHIEKLQHTWKREDGERNSVKNAFELGKQPTKISIQFSK